MIIHLFLPTGETDRALYLSTLFCLRAEKLNAREIFCVPADPGHRRELFAALAGEGFRVLAGAARSCLVARLASLALRRPSLPRRALAVESTPAGPLAVVPKGREAAFLAPLPVGLLWSVPAGLKAELIAHGLFTIGDVARVSVAALGRRFGPWPSPGGLRPGGGPPHGQVLEPAAPNLSALARGNSRPRGLKGRRRVRGPLPRRGPGFQ